MDHSIGVVIPCVKMSLDMCQILLKCQDMKLEVKVKVKVSAKIIVKGKAKGLSKATIKT